MSDIDNLNFKVIIDDSQFKKKIQTMESLAKNFNTSLSNLLNIKAVSQELVVSNRKRNQMETDNIRALEQQNRERIKTQGLQDKLNAQVEKINNGYKNQSRILQELKGYALGYLSIHGATQLVSSLIKITGEFENQRTTLGAMLGDLEEAKHIVSDIQGLAAESPFSFKELTTYAKQLSAFSVPAEELLETTKMLADVSAGLGVDMNRIVLAYGQVRSAAFLRGQEVRQFTEAGIPILDELARQFTELEGRAVSTGEVFDKISARLVPFEMVAKVFKDMTSEGGKFFNMQEIQAETLKGKYENLKDVIEQTVNAIGEAHSDKLKGAIDWAKDLAQNWQSVGGQLVDIIKLFGAYKAAVMLLNISDTIAKFGGLAKAIKSTAAAQALMNSALLTNPFIVMGTAVTAVAIAIARHRKELDGATRAQMAYNERVSEFSKIERERANKIQNLVNKVQDETQATVEREAALLSLKESYPKIFEQYDIESLKLADILSIKKQIAEEDAKQRRLSALGAIGAQEGRIKALVARGAADSYKNDAFKMLEELEKGYLRDFVLPDIVSGFKSMTDEALKKALDDAFRKSQYDVRGLEVFDNVPTSKEFYEKLYAAIQSEIEKRKNTQVVDGWRKLVQETLTGMGLNEGTSFGLWAKDTTLSTEYVEDMIKRYKELKEEIKWVSSFDTEQADRLKKNKDAIEAIAKALKIDIKNLAANTSETWEEKEEKRIKRLIDSLRDLQSQYEKAKNAGASDEGIKAFFEEHYPDLIKEQGKEFVTSLNYLEEAKKLIEELAKYDPEAAKKLAAEIGGDEFEAYLKNLTDQQKAYKESARAAREYFESIRRWATEDFNLEGEGIALDVSKVASDLREKLGEIDLRARKAKELLGNIDIDSEEEVKNVKALFEKEFGEGSWDKFYAEYVNEGEKAIERFAKKQEAYEKKLAQEKLNDLSKKYVNEATEGMNLSDWGDKSIRQIEEIRQRLEDLVKEDIKLPQSTIDELSKLGLSTDVLIKKIKELFSGQLENATIEKFKALSEIATEISNMSSSVGDQLSQLGDTLGNDFVKGIGKSLRYLSELADIFTDCESLMVAFTDTVEDAAEATEEAGEVVEDVAKSSDWIIMIAKLAIRIVGQITEGINESQQALQDARMAAIQYSNALAQLQYDSLMSSFESIFGVDDYGKFKAAMTEAKKYQEEILEIQKKIGYERKLLTLGRDDIVKDVFTANLGEGDIFVDMRTNWQKFWGTGKDLLKSFNISEFLNEDGTLNGEALKEFYATYGDYITDANKEAIEEMLGQFDLYTDAITEIANYMSSIFGQVADDMADSFIESFKESGEAALDYGDIMDDVATHIAKSVIKSMIIKNVFDDKKAEEAAQKLFTGDVEGAMQIIDKAMQSAEQLSPYIQKLLESLQPYLNMENDVPSDLGSGIKGITEETAGLLASYINAIRSDVSQMRALQAQHLPTISAAMPVLAFQVARIQADTQNIARDTNQMLSHVTDISNNLGRVVTSEGGDTAIRVLS